MGFDCSWHLRHFQRRGLAPLEQDTPGTGGSRHVHDPTRGLPQSTLSEHAPQNDIPGSVSGYGGISRQRDYQSWDSAGIAYG